MFALSATRTLGACAALAALCACGKPDGQPAPETSVPATVSIMTFNVENLFDNNDDPGKDDYTYLPIDAKQSQQHKDVCAAIEVERWRDQCLYWDWNDAVVDKKLSAVAAAILQVGKGRGPDIVALQEVENIEILERLRNDYLSAAGYLPAVLIEGHDLRGIDVAFLSRLPLEGTPRLHAFPTEGIDIARRNDTRGILEATFQLPGGGLMTGFAVHFPAPFHPTDMRIAAYNHLNGLKRSLPADHAVFAAGDFNTTSAEDAEQDLLGRFARPDWTVVHETGCENCRGTQYYAPADSWSFLDMILWSPPTDRGKNTTWKIRAGSVAIANRAAGQTLADGTPGRFEMPDASGVSDHWPLVFSIERK